MSEIFVKHYKKEKRETVSRMMAEAGKDFRDKIMSQIDTMPQNAFYLDDAGKCIGAGVHLAVRGRQAATFNMYVKEAYRHHGCGSQLLQTILVGIKSNEAEIAMCEFQVDDSIKHFFEKNGFESWYLNKKLVYCGKKIPKYDGAGFIAYDDVYFQSLIKLAEETDFAMYKKRELAPYLMTDNELWREELAEDKESYFLRFDGDDIIALGFAGHGRIGRTIVAEKARGSDTEKEFTEFALNKLHAEGCKAPVIWLPECYEETVDMLEDMGFVTEKVHQLMKKEF